MGEHESDWPFDIDLTDTGIEVDRIVAKLSYDAEPLISEAGQGVVGLILRHKEGESVLYALTPAAAATISFQLKRASETFGYGVGTDAT
jgi:hypothetical protein